MAVLFLKDLIVEPRRRVATQYLRVLGASNFGQREGTMKLVGNYMSPFVRRVAVSLNALELPFELQVLVVSKEPEQVRVYNPVVRIPALLLDDGDVLVDSNAILDEIDQMVGPDRALTPASGRKRREVMKITAIALGSMEKAMWAVYERRFRPEEKVHQPWIDRNDRQVLGGLRFLDELASKTSRDGWLAGGTRLSQADITGAVAYTFAHAVRPHLNLAEEIPNLANFAARCEAMPIFRNASLPASAS
jgi:glutathione S-transferase